MSDASSSTNEQNSGCQCKGTCGNKDGRVRKGCPCKTAGRKCEDSICKCNASKCKNKEGFVRTSRPPARAGEGRRNARSGSQTDATQRLSELEECAKENSEVKQVIMSMPEMQVTELAIRVLSRGVGNLEFIQSQVAADEEQFEDENETHQRPVNIYGSPIANRSLLANLSPVVGRADNLGANTDSETHGSDGGVASAGASGGTGSGGGSAPSGSSGAGARTTQNLHVMPEWCKCGYCRTMPNAIENVCCKKRACAAQSTRFYKLCLDADIVQLCVLNRADISNDPLDNSTKQFRKAAYRQFILDKHGYLGRGVRRVVPSCCVLKVRPKYPSPTGVYMGFRQT